MGSGGWSLQREGSHRKGVKEWPLLPEGKTSVGAPEPLPFSSHSSSDRLGFSRALTVTSRKVPQRLWGVSGPTNKGRTSCLLLRLGWFAQSIIGCLELFSFKPQRG